MNGGLGVLQRIAASRPARPAADRCDMCGRDSGPEHSHVVDVHNRSLLCTCRPCYLLFSRDDADLSFRAVPDRYAAVPDFELSLGQWDDLAIPVSIAFFLSHSTLARVAAFYPSPAGATESELPLDAWAQIVAANPMLADLRPDVQAALLRRVGDVSECYLVPVDVCYELVGHLRSLWRGFDGGTDVHRRIDAFFDTVRERCARGSR